MSEQYWYLSPYSSSKCLIIHLSQVGLMASHCLPPIHPSYPYTDPRSLLPSCELFIFFFFLGPQLQHMEVPRLGVESELQLLAHTTATWDPSRICNLHHSSQQCQIPDPLSRARDRTFILMDTSHIHFHYATGGTPWWAVFIMPGWNTSRLTFILFRVV